ncbi:MAG: OsmC family protein [Xanthobacteraceae bacterium]|jgi:putative redox protein
MAHARATIGTTNYAVSITAGHHQLGADEGPALGGKDTGPAPFEILCSALGACTAITLRMYAERKAWPLRGLSVDVRFSGTGKEGAIARMLSFEGELSQEQRAQLADIAERTPVTLTLKNGVAITTTVA